MSLKKTKRDIARYGLFQRIPIEPFVEEEAQKCILLWRAVLDRVLLDLIDETLPNFTRLRAVHFIQRDDHFTEVCDMAELLPEKVERVIDEVVYKFGDPERWGK